MSPAQGVSRERAMGAKIMARTAAEQAESMARFFRAQEAHYAREIWYQDYVNNTDEPKGWADAQELFLQEYPQYDGLVD